MSAPGFAGRPRRAFIALGRAKRLPGKFLLPVDGTPMIAREIRTLASLNLEVALVSVAPVAELGIPVIRDCRDAGPLGALATALEVADEPFFLFGGDMPFLDAPSIDLMRQRFRGRSIVPSGPGGELEVLHAIYAGVDPSRVDFWLRRAGGLRDLVGELERGGNLERMAPGEIDPRSFTDIDTPEEYARVSASPARAD
jgi:molybdopterin-guanine dinucleotide biosynthesis protein A